MTTNDYRPIDCATHSELELLALRRADVAIDHRGDGPADERIEGIVVDLETRHRVEYLIVRTAGGVRQLRLDRVRRVFADGQCIAPRQ